MLPRYYEFFNPRGCPLPTPWDVSKMEGLLLGFLLIIIPPSLTVIVDVLICSLEQKYPVRAMQEYPRAAACFEDTGLKVIPASADQLHDVQGKTTLLDFLPNANALAVSSKA